MKLAFLPQFKQTKGFTLIELLVVIGILGILAAALVAALDPFEQLKKAQDSNLKSDAVEVVSATTRYYSTHNSLPWSATGTNCYSGGGGESKISSATSAVLLSDSNFGPCLDALIADGELKSAFKNQTADLQKLSVNTSTGDTYVCFKPNSKALQKDPTTQYTSTGAACTPSSGTCYWCAR